MIFLEEREKIYTDYISDVAMEISISKLWRSRIFSLKPNQIIRISANDKIVLPQYIKDVIIDYDLIFCVQVVDECEENFDDGLIIFKFYSEEFPNIISYSGNNPNVI